MSPRRYRTPVCQLRLSFLSTCLPHSRMAGGGSTSKPSSIKLPAKGIGSVSSPNPRAAGGEGRTPTQETSREESLSKRRGSESLSIGIPAGVSAAVKKGGAAGASSTLTVTPMDTPKVGGNATAATGGKGGNAAASTRPGVVRQNASPPNGGSAAVSDGSDDEEGYLGEREADQRKSGSGAASRSSNGHTHMSRSEASSTSSASSQSTMTGIQNLADRQSKQAYCVQKDASNATAAANGKHHSNGKGPAQHSFDIHGTQPVRNHHHRASTTSSINSTRRDKDIPCFPTPGMKDENRNPFEEEKSFEEIRLLEAQAKTRHWKRWGPYLSERQWVRCAVSVNSGCLADAPCCPFRSSLLRCANLPFFPRDPIRFLDHSVLSPAPDSRKSGKTTLSQATVREDYSANGDAWTHFPHEHARSRAYRWGEDGLGGISDNHQRLCFGLALWNGKDPILKERMFGTTGHQGNHGEDVKELYYYLDSTPTHSYMKYLYKYPQRPFPYEQLVRESTQRSRDVVEYEITDTDAFDDDKYWDIFVEVSAAIRFVAKS